MGGCVSSRQEATWSEGTSRPARPAAGEHLEQHNGGAAASRRLTDSGAYAVDRTPEHHYPHRGTDPHTPWQQDHAAPLQDGSAGSSNWSSSNNNHSNHKTKKQQHSVPLPLPAGTPSLPGGTPTNTHMMGGRGGERVEEEAFDLGSGYGTGERFVRPQTAGNSSAELFDVAGADPLGKDVQDDMSSAFGDSTLGEDPANQAFLSMYQALLELLADPARNPTIGPFLESNPTGPISEEEISNLAFIPGEIQTPLEAVLAIEVIILRLQVLQSQRNILVGGKLEHQAQELFRNEFRQAQEAPVLVDCAVQVNLSAPEPSMVVNIPAPMMSVPIDDDDVFTTDESVGTETGTIAESGTETQTDTETETETDTQTETDTSSGSSVDDGRNFGHKNHGDDVKSLRRNLRRSSRGSDSKSVLSGVDLPRSASSRAPAQDTIIEEFRESSKPQETVTQDGYTMLNQYYILKDLGEGTFGKVSLAYSEETKQFYAIKMCLLSKLREARLKDSQGREDLIREVSIVKKLHHPHIVRLLELIRDPRNDRICFVMELVDRGAIMNFRSDGTAIEPSISENQVRRYIFELIMALMYLHQHHIVHRDIKPENILVSSDDKVKLTDFGISQRFEEEDIFTCGGIGTPYYMAPEMLIDEPRYSGIKADIWALGITLYALVFGRLPFFDTNIINMQKKIRESEVSYPEGLVSAVMIDFLQLILKKNPEERISLEGMLDHRWLKDYAVNRLDLLQFQAEPNVDLDGEEDIQERDYNAQGKLDILKMAQIGSGVHRKMKKRRLRAMRQRNRELPRERRARGSEYGSDLASMMSRESLTLSTYGRDLLRMAEANDAMIKADREELDRQNSGQLDPSNRESSSLQAAGRRSHIRRASDLPRMPSISSMSGPAEPAEEDPDLRHLLGRGMSIKISGGDSSRGAEANGRGAALSRGRPSPHNSSGDSREENAGSRQHRRSLSAVVRSDSQKEAVEREAADLSRRNSASKPIDAAFAPSSKPFSPPIEPDLDVKKDYSVELGGESSTSTPDPLLLSQQTPVSPASPMNTAGNSSGGGGGSGGGGSHRRQASQLSSNFRQMILKQVGEKVVSPSTTSPEPVKHRRESSVLPYFGD